MVKRILTICVVAAFSLAATSQTLVVKTKTTGDINFLFSEKPVITCSDEGMTVTSSSQTLTFAFSDIDNIHILSDNVTAIQEITPNVSNSLTAIVYDINGMLICTLQPTKDGQIDFSSLPAGTYIVKTGSLTYKLHR